MTPTFRFGRIAGIEVGAHWTWLLVAALLIWSLAADVFPETNPGLDDGTYVAMAFAAAALFFSSLFLHELGHALQARRDSVEIEGITLWVFGGVAHLRGDIPSPGAELRIAAAGPAVSLALGAACLAPASVVPLPSAVDGIIHWLGYINLTLLAFNLIPAFPLDGGRILRAALWSARGDLAAATRAAAAAGRGFAILLIVGGFCFGLLGGTFAGLWLAFTGFFLLGAAEAELAMAQSRTAQRGARVVDDMVDEPGSVHPDLTLQRFLGDVVRTHCLSAYPVMADGEAIGPISFRDALAVPREQRQRLRVRDRMLPRDRMLIVHSDRELADVIPELAREEPRRALLLADGRAAGLLSVTDVLRVLEVLAAERAGVGGWRSAAAFHAGPAPGHGSTVTRGGWVMRRGRR
jgi:Zn-dependent protease